MGKRLLSGAYVLSCTLNWPLGAHAELTPMDDASLSNVSGGIGIVLDDVKLIGSPDSNLSLTFDTSLSADAGYFDHISLYGSDSSAACDSSPSIAGCAGVDVGTAADPVRLNIVSGTSSANPSYLELKWPENSASESGIDFNFRLLVTGFVDLDNADGDNNSSTGTEPFADVTWWEIDTLKLYGTSMKVWGAGVVPGGSTVPAYNGGSSVGIGVETVLNANVAELRFDTANSRAVSCAINCEYEKFPGFLVGGVSASASDTSRFKADGTTDGLLRLQNVQLSNLRMGFYPYLPLVIGAIDEGVGNPANFYLEMPLLQDDPTIYNAFYSLPKADITIGNIELGGSQIGGASITGVRIQHLRIETNG